MAFSVNTNVGAMAALQGLNATGKGLATTQNRINSGMNVASTKDDSAAFAIAQGLRGKLGDLKAVTSSLSNAKSVTDVAVSGAEQVSDIVNQMKTLAKQAGDAGITTEQRSAYDNDFKALVSQITTIVNSSSFNGTNLLKTSGGTVSALQSLNNAYTGSGSGGYTPDTLTVANQTMDLATTAAPAPSGTVTALTTYSTLDTVTHSQQMTRVLDNLAKDINTKLSTLGSASRKIDAQMTFNSKLSDTIESGIGNLVDADLAKESAKLQSLQVKQQLGMQALSIANQGPSAITSLFK